ncbi:MAG: type II secretion system F family protein [Alphaproteobacteria bacterium]|nr:type II secretion system F family protein [Alphaproteobacteria bacterium]MCK5555715.1 type II secretion system F family protein [Alphaproteobacteria bacterium]
MSWPITIGVIIVFLSISAVISVYIGKRQARLERYRSVICRAKAGSSQDGSAEKAAAKQRADIAKKLKGVSDETQGKKKDKTSLSQLLQQAGFETSVPRFWLNSAIFAVFVGGLLLLTSWAPTAKIFMIFTAFLGLPKLFIGWKIKRRQKKFLKEFPDALDAMARLLQAGMPMSEAIAMTSREYKGPLKDEMLRIYENQKVGIPLGEAAQMTARRMPLPEVHMFATALQIQSETGSSLSEVLYNLSAVIRARFRLRRKVQALSSEAKSSAAIIGALPVLVTLGLYAARPEYVGILFIVPKGQVFLGGAIFWMFLGCLMMRQMINFRI